MDSGTPLERAPRMFLQDSRPDAYAPPGRSPVDAVHKTDVAGQLFRSNTTLMLKPMSNPTPPGQEGSNCGNKF